MPPSSYSRLTLLRATYDPDALSGPCKGYGASPLRGTLPKCEHLGTLVPEAQRSGRVGVLAEAASSRRRLVGDMSRRGLVGPLTN